MRESLHKIADSHAARRRVIRVTHQELPTVPPKADKRHRNCLRRRRHAAEYCKRFPPALCDEPDADGDNEQYALRTDEHGTAREREGEPVVSSHFESGWGWVQIV